MGEIIFHLLKVRYIENITGKATKIIKWIRYGDTRR